MDIDLDTGRLVVFLSGMFAWIFIEQCFAARRPAAPRAPRITLHVAAAVLNTTITRMFAYVPMLLWIVHVEQQGWGLARWLGLHGWLEFVVSIIVLDAFDYFWHRANHRIPFLWRFHKTHHHDNEMDVFTALRFHPGELLISFLAKAGWILIWGPSAIAWFLFEVLVSFCAQMHHSNIDLPDGVDRVLSKVLVTPRFHATHHIVDREYGDRNFSTIFSVWDPLFRTRARHLTHEEMDQFELGLPEGRDKSLSHLELLLEPIRSRNLNLASQKDKVITLT